MNSSTSCLLWPFVAIWKLLAAILGFTGRLIGIVLGVVFMIVGGVLIVTVILVPVGIPLAALGLLFVVKGLF